MASNCTACFPKQEDENTWERIQDTFTQVCWL